MTVILSNTLLSRNVCLHTFSRAAIFEHFFSRRYSIPRIRAKMHEAHIDYNETDNQFICTLHYTNESLKVDRTFNFVRTSTENVQKFLSRIDISIRTAAFKKVKKKKSSDTTAANIITKEHVKDDKIVLVLGKEELNGDTPCTEFLGSSEPVKLYIFGEEYKFKYNVPKVTHIKLADHIMATFPTYPRKLEAKNVSQAKSSFTWYRSNPVKNRIEWVQVGTGFVHTPSTVEVGSKLKLVCEPKNEDNETGPTIEVTSNDNVQAAPDRLPFQKRHKCTESKLSGNKFRVVTYNILADMYSESPYSKTVLFPYCPEYALDMEYRKNLIIKELMGYNADIICLQEVDRKVFARDLDVILPLSKLKGVYHNKPNVEEGLAIFFDETRFDLLSSQFSLMSENTNSLDEFAKVWSQLQNESTKSAFVQRPNIIQAIALRSKENPSRIILLGNTHLYFHPKADNIRLLQAYYAVTYLKNLAANIRKEYPNATVSLMFCGDFNSSPKDGIFKLFTENYLAADSEDWRTSQQDLTENITLKQDVRFGSACGTPKYTNYTANFADCLDYIFYDREQLIVEQSVAFPTEEELSEYTAIPSPLFPSDHISLCADLKWL